MSNNSKRIIVGIIGIPLFLYIIFSGGIYFTVLCFVIQSLCLWEFLKMFESKNIYALKILTLIISVTLFALLYYKLYFGLIIILLPVLTEVFREKKRNPLNAVLSVFGIIYITIPFLLLNELEKNFLFVIYLFVLIWICDTFAYFGGKLFGKHKLTSISPNKTVEGAVAGMLFTVAASLAFYYFKSDFINLRDSILLGLIIGAVSQIGDNFESLLKRYTGVKDSSMIIPGHGGFLDRFDSLIFVTPFLYIYINFIQ
jgi:phosphatidate cytidylyltransferase